MHAGCLMTGRRCNEFPMEQPMNRPLSGAAPSDEDLRLMDAWWRAANYLSVGQIYLLDNPLLERALERADLKPRLLGHFGTTPGLNFVYVHLNRVIKSRNLDVIYICGPGHGGPGMAANTWLEGTYSELYPSISQNAEGMRRPFRKVSSNIAMARTRTSSAAARIPGARSGTSTWRKTRNVPAPKTRAAASSRGSICSMYGVITRTTNGTVGPRLATMT